jgi:hypothetical protein
VDTELVDRGLEDRGLKDRGLVDRGLVDRGLVVGIVPRALTTLYFLDNVRDGKRINLLNPVI